MADYFPLPIDAKGEWLSGLDFNPNNGVAMINFRNPVCRQLHRYLQYQLHSNNGICDPYKSPTHNAHFCLIVMCLITNEAAYRNVHYDSLAFNVLHRVWDDVKKEFNRKTWNWSY